MGKFVVISQPDSAEKILAWHPVLKYLPVKYAKKYLSYLPVQVAGAIIDIINNDELGYMLDVPGFLMDWDKLSERQRIKQLKSIVGKLKKLGSSTLCFPLVQNYLTKGEILYLLDHNINVLDGFVNRLASQLLVLKHLFVITRKDLPFLEAGVWGADTDIGRIWVEAIASRVNHMCIGGQNREALDTLADQILSNTGLSCQITDSPSVCLKDKHIAVSAQSVDIDYPKGRPSFHFLSYPGPDIYSRPSPSNKPYYAQGIYFIEMGWMSFPDQLTIDHSLHTWEELGLLEGLISAASKVYRDHIRNEKITLSQIQRLHALYEMYPLKVQGFFQGGKRIHFDRIRMDYYRIRKHRGTDLHSKQEG